MLSGGIILYLALGFFLVLVSPFRKIIMEGDSVDEVNAEGEWWQIALLYLIVYAAAILLWPVFLRDWYQKWRLSESGEGELTLGDLRELMDAMSDLSADNISGDKFPNGSGRFGYEPTNPIPCNSIFGSMSYLSSLRTPDGEPVNNHRIGSTSAEISDMPIDMYRISDMNDQEIAVLYLSPYQERNSELAPEGFKLIH